MLTVLIATHNGARTLAGVLEAYEKLESPRDGWKLVVVDNGSTDGTGDILRSFQDRLPLTCVFEPQDGKNTALNSALPHVSGDLVVFSDDDAFPRADWLVRLREAADRHLEFSIFGGLVLPRWEVQPPDWILSAVPLAPVFALSSSKLKEGPMPAGHVFGPNMAIRASVFDAGLRFDQTIGPRRSGNYPMGSETEFVQRLAGLGLTSWHAEGAIVEHFVRAGQLQPGWILGRARRFGRGQYCLAQKQAAQTFPCWGGVPRFLFRKLAHAAASWLAAAVRGTSADAFRSKWEMNVVYGQMIEARAIARAPRPGTAASAHEAPPRLLGAQIRSDSSAL